MSMPPASRALMLVGSLQGAALWFLWHAADTPHWPSNIPMLMGALLWSALAVPIAIYLSENAGLSRLRRLQLVLGVGVLYLCFGVYAGWLGSPVDAMEQQNLYGSFAHVLAALVLGFIVVPLLAGREQGRWHYPQLFQLAWRNALLSASVMAVTGLFWAVLFAGGMLMKSLGLGFILVLIAEPIFAFPVTGMVVGAVFAQGHARADLLANLRHYWLTLNAWLLPLLLGFGVMWVVALPFTGLDELFDTRSAAAILLWFAALSVLFINCAWQDGQLELTYPRKLAAAIKYAWLTLPVVTVVAGWALWLRIDQYGLTEERIWAVFIWLLAAGYALGYCVSLLPSLQRRWMPRSDASAWMGSISSTNIVMAIITVLCLGLMASPVADPRRLAVSDQVDRLISGRMAANAFDYDYLRWRSDRWGIIALQELATISGDARKNDIAGRARQSLAQTERWGSKPASAKAVLTREETRQRIQQLQASAATDVIPDSLIDVLRGNEDGEGSDCLRPQQLCAIWMHDLNADGTPEAVVIAAYSKAAKDNARLYTQQGEQWRFAGNLTGMASIEEWETSIRAGKARMVTPDWNDIELNGQRKRIIPPMD
jgi:hypothetical protein